MEPVNPPPPLFKKANGSMTTPEPLEICSLTNPPIVEVVGGVVFNSIPDLDTLSLGVYWDSRKADYPKRQVLPALADEMVFTVGSGFPTRAFLTSADDQFVLQLQHDRMFFNWRSMGSIYPRFSAQHGAGGMLERILKEYSQFSEFISSRFGVHPVPSRIELTKIDFLRQFQHWKDLEDLAELVPVTGTFKEIQRSEGREFNLQFTERATDGATIVGVASQADQTNTHSVRIESRRVASCGSNIEDAFNKANGILNSTFFRLIPNAKARFGSEVSA